MKKKHLIVVADYYHEVANGLVESALKLIPKSDTIKIIKFLEYLKFLLQSQKILKNMIVL